MASQHLADRVAHLEGQLIQLQAEVRSSREHAGAGWRRAVEKFAGDEDLLTVLREAMELREADRKRARQRTSTRRRTQR